MDDIVAEILLRLPPDDPACLVRASAVCKPWLRLLSNPIFLRRYRAFHRVPPLLGFLHNLVDPSHPVPDRFVPTSASSVSPPTFRSPNWQALDCRHGRALLDSFPFSADFVVWHPMTGEQRRLPRPAFPYFVFYTAAVLCSAAGCDHLDCRGGPFLVVVVGTDVGDDDTWATVYSSESDAWSPPTSAYLGLDPHFGMEKKPAALVGDALYFALAKGSGILKYNLGKHFLSLIDPPVLYKGGIVLKPMEDNVLGLVGQEGFSLSLWSGDVSLDGIARWNKCRVIELESLLPSLDRAEPVLIAFVDSADIVFVRTDAGVFMIELKSMCVTKVCEKGYFDTIIPYTSFCTPGVHLQHNRAQFSRKRARQPRAGECARQK